MLFSLSVFSLFFWKLRGEIEDLKLWRFGVLKNWRGRSERWSQVVQEHISEYLDLEVTYSCKNAPKYKDISYFNVITLHRISIESHNILTLNT